MNQLTTIFKLLSDETRLRILMLLYQEELCVCELAGIIESPQPRISKNLSKLRDLNLVNGERKEKYVFYRLKKENVFLIHTLQSIFIEIEAYPELDRDKTRLIEKEKYLNQCQVI